MSCTSVVYVTCTSEGSVNRWSPQRTEVHVYFSRFAPYFQLS